MVVFQGVPLWMDVLGPSATEKSLGTIRVEKGISFKFRVSISLWYDLSCWMRNKKPFPSFFTSTIAEGLAFSILYT